MKSLLLTTCTSPAQTQAQPAGLDFDTASIHLSNPAQPGFQAIKPMADGAGYLATYVPVKLMIAFMYRIPARQVKGGPRLAGRRSLRRRGEDRQEVHGR